MIGFLMALVAGYAVPMLDAPVSRPLAQALHTRLNIAEQEIRLVSFMVALLVATILSALFSSGSAFWIVMGVVLGYFGTRLYHAIRRAVEGQGEIDES